MTWAITCSLPGCVFVGSYNPKQRCNYSPGAPPWDAAVPEGVLIAAPNACPCSCFEIHVRKQAQNRLSNLVQVTSLVSGISHCGTCGTFQSGLNVNVFFAQHPGPTLSTCNLPHMLKKKKTKSLSLTETGCHGKIQTCAWLRKQIFQLVPTTSLRGTTPFGCSIVIVIFTTLANSLNGSSIHCFSIWVPQITPLTCLLMRTEHELVL